MTELSTATSLNNQLKTEYKIVILGAVGSGKTSAITAVADGHVVGTDVINTDSRVDKASTTVAMDYADVQLPGGDRLRVYGSPGQERFSFIWPILLQGASGVVILIDASASDPEYDFIQYLQVLKQHAAGIPAVVGLSKVDLAPEIDTELYYQHLESENLPLNVVSLDARDAKQIFNLLDVLINDIEASDLALLTD